MRANVVFTFTGPDRIGIVEEVTEILLGLRGNVEVSRMTRLGGEFAILMLVSLPAGTLDGLSGAFGHLTDQGYRLSVSQTDQTYAEAHPGWTPYRIEVHGADHEGIIHDIAHGLSQLGISVESMETTTARAPMSGTPLFSMAAVVAVPPNAVGTDWEAVLGEAAEESNVDVKVSAAKRA